MPELPEVEMTRRSFADALAGARIGGVHLGKPLRWPLGVVPHALQGLRVGQTRRRGKYLLMPLLAPAQDAVAGWLIWHLGMSGALQFAQALPPPGRHDHFELQTSRGLLRLHDPRRFGAVVHVPSLEAPMAQKLLSGLGPEPWDEAGRPLDAAVFLQRLRMHRMAVKQVLLSGSAVVGVGNIYASEALFLARIHPATPASRVGPVRALRLRDAVCEVLRKAIEAGGSTLRDFRDAHGHAGNYQNQMQVYDREGQPCPGCATPVRRIVQGQRSSWFCVHCQRP